MDPIVIELRISVVPDEEIKHLQLRNAKLQERYEELASSVDSLNSRYSELLYFFSVMKREVKGRT